MRGAKPPHRAGPGRDEPSRSNKRWADVATRPAYLSPPPLPPPRRGDQLVSVSFDTAERPVITLPSSGCRVGVTTNHCGIARISEAAGNTYSQDVMLLARYEPVRRDERLRDATRRDALAGLTRPTRRVVTGPAHRERCCAAPGRPHTSRPTLQ